MALQCDTQTQFGVVANYHRITNITYGDNPHIEVSLYINKDARDNNKPYLSREIYTSDSGAITETTIKANSMSQAVLAYTYLKTVDVYSGAVDV
jgi:hypothetical protein